MHTVSIEARLSSESKKLIKELFKQGYNPFQMKDAMLDDNYLSEACVSQEIAKEVHFWLRSLGV